VADSNLHLLFSDNCQSSGLYGSVESSQVKLGGVSVECGLVRFSCGLWNDRQNDQLSKQSALAWKKVRRRGRRAAGLQSEAPLQTVATLPMVQRAAAPYAGMVG
jgi:hypothetical protein